MITAKINKKDTLITDVVDDNGKAITICSSKVESEYLSPRQLVQSALAGCLSMTIRRELMNQNLSYEDVVVSVESVEDQGQTIYNYSISIDSEENSDVIEKLKETAIENCYIRGLLSAGIQMVEVEDLQGRAGVVCDCCCG